jgi:hypothetical protein
MDGCASEISPTSEFRGSGPNSEAARLATLKQRLPKEISPLLGDLSKTVTAYRQRTQRLPTPPHSETSDTHSPRATGGAV